MNFILNKSKCSTCLDIKMIYAKGLCETCYYKNIGRTEKGLLRLRYSNMKVNAKKRGMSPPNFSLLELETFAYTKGFKQLFHTWQISNYDHKLAPSFDRLSNKYSYTFDNLRLVTWQENRQQNWDEQTKETK